MGLYTIKPGDTLTSISKKNGTSIDEIVKLNGIKDPNRITAGNTLELPDSPSTGSTSSDTKSPIITAPAPTQPTLNYTSWDDTGKGQAASQERDDAKTALDSIGDFVWADQEKYNDYIKQYENRPDFSYDFNADALYQQYKDKYIQQGKMAMQDTMGQAAALTGGYGNSYAQSVGQQAYNAQLENLNDVIPELYQMALDKYNMEGQELLNMMGILSGERDYALGLHNDKYNKALDMLNRADSDYYNGANMHYTEQDTLNSLAQQNWQNEFNIWDANNTNAWNQAEFDEAVRQFDEQMAFNKQQYNDSLTLNNVQRDNNGNVVAQPKKTGSGITDSMRDKAKSFKSNEDLANWAYGLSDSGAISEEEANQLISEFMDENEKYIETKNDKGEVVSKTISYKDMVTNTAGWEVVNGGGANLFGIDRDAIVRAPNGKEIRLDDLKETLIKEGMKKEDAQKALKSLQKKLGISSNWLFGW